MNNSISILTEQSKTVIGDAIASLQGNVLAHSNGDWSYHNALRVYNTAYAQPGGGYAILDKSIRMLLSDPNGVNITVIVPTSSTGTNSAFGGGPPVILAGPSDLSLPVGSFAQFTVSMVSQTPPSFVWSKDTVPISGANASAYSITGITTLDAGTYACVVTNSYGTAATNGAILTVLTSSSGAGSTQLPIIAYQQPNVSQVITVNATTSLTTTVTLSIDVASDSAVTFRWQKDGVDIVYGPDLGAPTTYVFAQSWAGHAHGSVLTLQLRPGFPADAGQYRVICTNANGSVISQVWVITVI